MEILQIPKINLPSTYSGNLKEYEGKPKLSWSQIETWNSPKGFNTGKQGRQEYFLKYFFKKEFPDMGWGQFGHDVETYITIRDKANPSEEEKLAFNLANNSFTSEEKQVLDKIKPLDIQQLEGILDFGGFVVQMFIDDLSKDYSILRDYKTQSKSSIANLYSDKKFQLEIYSLFIRNKFKIIPKVHEYVVIEREGGYECFQGGGRKVLKVGKKITVINREITEERLLLTQNIIIKTAKEISEYWKIYNKFNI